MIKIHWNGKKKESMAKGKGRKTLAEKSQSQNFKNKEVLVSKENLNPPKSVLN